MVEELSIKKNALHMLDRSVADTWSPKQIRRFTNLARGDIREQINSSTVWSWFKYRDEKQKAMEQSLCSIFLLIIEQWIVFLPTVHNLCLSSISSAGSFYTSDYNDSLQSIWLLRHHICTTNNDTCPSTNTRKAVLWKNNYLDYL